MSGWSDGSLLGPDCPVFGYGSDGWWSPSSTVSWLWPAMDYSAARTVSLSTGRLRGAQGRVAQEYADQRWGSRCRPDWSRDRNAAGCSEGAFLSWL